MVLESDHSPQKLRPGVINFVVLHGTMFEKELHPPPNPSFDMFDGQMHAEQEGEDHFENKMSSA
jgi:hypothetical protein